MTICKMCYECKNLDKDCTGAAFTNPKLGKPCGRYELANDDDPETPHNEPQDNNSASDDPQDESEPDTGTGTGTDAEPVALSASDNDLKHANFVRLAAKRTETALHHIRLIGNLGGQNYRSSMTERRNITSILQDAIDELFVE